MPILSVYFGVSLISALVYHDEENFEFLKFPYSYSKDVLSNYTTEEDFNKAAIDILLKSTRKKLSSFDVLTAGYLTEAKVPFETKLSSTAPVMLNSVERMNPILANTWGISVREKTASRANMNVNFGSDDYAIFSDGLDFFSSMSIYPSVSPVELSTRAHIDQEIIEIIADEGSVLYEGYPLVFTGDRFSQFVMNDELDYVFMLGFVSKPGVYDMYLDKHNAVILSQLLKTHSRDLEFSLEESLTDIGTLISTTGYTECVLRKEIGTNQLIEVKKDEVFVVQIKEDMKGTIIVKNHEIGTVEKVITGGSMGLIFDTREKKGSVAGDIKIFNDSIKQFDRVLRGL